MDARNRITLPAEKEIPHPKKEEQFGRVCLLFSLSGREVRGLTLEGFRYPLRRSIPWLLGDGGLSVSNEILDEDPARISYREGRFWCWWRAGTDACQAAENLC